MNNEEKNKLRKSSSLLLILVLLLLIVIGGTYAFYTQTIAGTEENVIRAANLKLTLNEKASSGIDLDKAIPVSDVTGEKNTPFTFTLTNDGDKESKYTIYLEDIASAKDGSVTVTSENRMQDAGVKFYFTSTNTSASKHTVNSATLLSTLNTQTTGKRILEEGTIPPGSTYDYTLKLWITEEATMEQVNGKIFAAKLNIEATFSDAAQ